LTGPLDSRPAPPPSAGGAAGTSSIPRGPKLGTPLGRYLLLDILGHGAMASVFRARDSQLGRDVAVKVMGMTIATRGEGAERFRREAQAVAALKHPGIVEIYDFVDATAEEPSYIVAELIEGPTLRRLLDERQARLLPEVAALIALPLAEALASAHARGIVHRDVKPDNVMIERRSDRSRVVITDFGVAHITGLETMTATGALVGSPAYMSPEQARAHEVGPGADIWALGVLLYEMATGCLPFPGKDPFSVVASIVRGSFRRPSQIAATVGPRFERIVLRCLSPNPAARYQNAGELAADLRELAGEAALLPEQPALCRFLDDPTKFEAELRPRVADAAVAEARRRAHRGELARALAEIGRATAYVPSHAGANALLKKLSAGRTALRVAGLVAAGLVLATATWLAWHPPWRKPAPVVSAIQPNPAPQPISVIPVPPAAEPTLPVASPSAEAKAPIPGAPSVNAPRVRTAASVADKPKPARRVSTTGTSAVPQPAATSTVAPAEQPAPSPAPAPAPAPAPQPAATPKTPKQPSPGVVQLFATGAICYPSLDAEPATVFMPRYEGVAPGRHRIFCTRNKGGAKEPVGEIDVPPGARVERTVTQKDGKLVLARPQ
jgi:eukaryotic-like serine/threonine-protein kinase